MTQERTCAECGASLAGMRAHSRYCSPTCARRAQRRAKRLAERGNLPAGDRYLRGGPYDETAKACVCRAGQLAAVRGALGRKLTPRETLILVGPGAVEVGAVGALVCVRCAKRLPGSSPSRVNGVHPELGSLPLVVKTTRPARWSLSTHKPEPGLRTRLRKAAA